VKKRNDSTYFENTSADELVQEAEKELADAPMRQFQSKKEALRRKRDRKKARAPEDSVRDVELVSVELVSVFAQPFLKYRPIHQTHL
jgi:hypothetical protein